MGRAVAVWGLELVTNRGRFNSGGLYSYQFYSDGDSRIEEIPMKLTIRVENEDGATPVTVAEIVRQESLQAGNLGLSLCAAKALLSAVQRTLVERQIAVALEERPACPDCRHRPSIKDYKRVRFQTLFGTVHLKLPRFCCCPCVNDGKRTQAFSISGLKRWVSPELEYVQAKLAATLPYAKAAELMSLLLPVDIGAAPSTVRRRTLAVRQRLDNELRDAGMEVSPDNRRQCKKKTIVGLDGGYIRDGRKPRAGKDGNFEVVAGRILTREGQARSIGFVRSVERNVHVAHRIKVRLKEIGGDDRRLTMLTDGDAGLRALQLTAFPASSHILDWYHLTRYITVIRNVLHSEEAMMRFPTQNHELLRQLLISFKWRLWHGRTHWAIARLNNILFQLKRIGVANKRPTRKLRRLIKRLLAYLKNNTDSLTNYGWRYRHGRRISTSFVESAVNQLIDKRMSKSQQMRWSPAGAHALLQVRAELVDGKLREAFARWYPAFATHNDHDESLALAA